jgi:hypothetical protein
MNATAQSRDKLAGWLDSHVGQTVTAHMILEEGGDDGDDRFFACDVLGVEGELRHDEEGTYRIGDSSILGVAGARYVHVSNPEAREHGVDFVHVELRDGVILSISARGDGVTA